MLSLDKDGKPAANLATEWSYDATNTTLSLTLRDDVKFTDGTPFDAAAVKANLEKAKQSTGEAGSALRAVESVTVVDATHADIVLSAPGSLAGGQPRPQFRVHGQPEGPG